MHRLRSRARRLRRKAASQSLLLTCLGAAILIGAGPIVVGGQDGALIQTAGGDLLMGYALIQARSKRSERRKKDDSSEKDEDE